MALIKCPECGLEISDKAIECIHCGKKFIVEEDKTEELKCSECEAVLNPEDKICKNCGCPVEINNATNDKPQQVEVTNIKMTDKTRKTIIIIAIAVILCFIGMFGYKIYSGNRAEKEYQNAYNEYIDNLEQAQIFMLSGGSDAESLCNLTLRVWQNAIYEERDDETDKYTRSKSRWNDFNTALVNLYADSTTITKVSNIESNQATVKELIKELQNPPEGLDKCYETVSDLYEDYKKLTDLAKNPSGSYSSFAESKKEAVEGFMASFEKLDNQIPEKVTTE